jgi:hypothetical protein
VSAELWESECPTDMIKAGTVDIDILQQRIPRTVHHHRPKLRLNESQILKDAIGSVVYDEADRTARDIGNAFGEIITKGDQLQASHLVVAEFPPYLAVAVESPDTHTVKAV